jgi:hypothetical protein
MNPAKRVTAVWHIRKMPHRKTPQVRPVYARTHDGQDSRPRDTLVYPVSTQHPSSTRVRLHSTARSALVQRLA